MWSYWSPIRCLPRWWIGERSADMEGTGEIKYPGQTKTSTAALWLTEGSVKPRGRKPQNKSPGPPGWELCEGPATHPWKTLLS